MNNPLIQIVEESAMKKDPPKFEIGDTVTVHVRIIEGDKERIQAFRGVVIKLRKGVDGGSFTVRRVSRGIGVERTFLYQSPLVDKVEVLNHGKVRRAKLYYLRRRSGKMARLKEKRADRVVAEAVAAEPVAAEPPEPSQE